MSVISLTIIENSIEIMSGIPKSVTVSTNVPATIFYTLDGTEPSVSSSVYAGEIKLPTNQNTVIFKVFATDGSISSAIITNTYRPDISNLRQPFDTVSGISSSDDNFFPYGSPATSPQAIYGNSAGNIVDSIEIENIPDGYDGFGNIANGTDAALDTYKLIFSERSAIGETGRGIGTLPAQVTIRMPQPIHPSTSSNVNDRFFNAKAAVIYQDSRDAVFDENMCQINRQSFTLVDNEKYSTGNNLFTPGHEAGPPSGNFLRSHYNPRDNTITYYYFDSITLRWIISKEPFQPKTDVVNLFNMVFPSRNEGVGFVFRWVPFKSRYL